MERKTESQQEYLGIDKKHIKKKRPERSDIDIINNTFSDECVMPEKTDKEKQEERQVHMWIVTTTDLICRTKYVVTKERSMRAAIDVCDHCGFKVEAIQHDGIVYM